MHSSTFKSSKMSSMYEKQQLHVAQYDRKFLYVVIIAYSIIQIVTGTVSTLQSSSITSSTRTPRVLLRIVYYFIFNLSVFLLFRSKKRKQIRASQFIETFIVLLVGASQIAFYVFKIVDSNNLSSSEVLQDQIDVYSSDSGCLLWFVLLISFIKRNMNVVLYIICVIIGQTAYFFNISQWMMGGKTLAQGIIVIFLLVYLGKKRLESFFETWRLKAAGVLYKNVLNSLPESIMVLTESGKVEYRNDHLVKMFEYDVKDGFGGFASNFSTLRLRDCIEEVKFKLFSVTNSSFAEKGPFKKTNYASSQTENLFKSKAVGIQSLPELTTFFRENVEIWARMSDHTLVFDTSYSHLGTQKNYSIEIKAFVIVAAQEVQLALIFRDTTDRDRIVTLESENEVYKNSVIASFSHELRTPLNSNMGLLEQGMDRSDVAPEIKETLIEPALVSAKLLLHLINSILDYSQLLSRNFQLRVKPFPIGQTIGKCLYLFERQINDKGLELEVNIQGEEDTLFYTDHERLSQILVNLLSNALKFTYKGTIRVEFLEEADRCFRINVVDTGIGMDEATQEKLRKNLQAGKVIEPKISTNSAGIGLGLFMSSLFCEVITSELSPGLHFNSTKGKGSEFYFLLKDFCPPDEIGGETRRKQENNTVKTFKTCVSLLSEGEENHAGLAVVANYRTQNFKNKLLESKTCPILFDEEPIPREVVILVDDEIFNLLVLENYCKTAGLVTERAFNGQEAIEKIEKLTESGSKVRIVMMDVNMPIMDGYETTKNLRNMVKNKKIEELIIVGVTAYVSKEKIDQGYECGMDEVVNKPFSQADFLRVMKKYGII